MDRPVNMGFGMALSCLREGNALTRRGWNGAKQFLYLVGPGNYPARSGVAKVHWGEEALVPYRAYIAHKGVDGNVTPWTASQTDILANDWEVVSSRRT